MEFVLGFIFGIAVTAVISWQVVREREAAVRMYMAEECGKIITKYGERVNEIADVATGLSQSGGTEGGI